MLGHPLRDYTAAATNSIGIIIIIAMEEEPEWTESHHLVGTRVSLPVILNGSRTAVTTSITHFGPSNPALRRPPLWRALVYKNDDDDNAPQLAYDLVASEVQQQQNSEAVTSTANASCWKTVPLAQGRYQMHLIRQIEKHVWPTIFSTALVEEILTQYTRHSGSSNHGAQLVRFTPSMILSRIQAACGIIQSQQVALNALISMNSNTATHTRFTDANTAFLASGARRTSSRLIENSIKESEAAAKAVGAATEAAKTDNLWKVQPGGRIARRIQEHLDKDLALDVNPEESDQKDKDDLAVNNPFLPSSLDAPAVLEFIGRKTKQLTMSDLQNLWDIDAFFQPAEADQELLDHIGDIRCKPVKDDIDLEDLDPAQFGKTQWKIMDDNTDYARIARMEAGHAVFPDWKDQMKEFCTKFEYSPQTDEDVARQLMEEETNTTGRSTRGRTMFYGTQTFTQKQLMDAILRQMSDASYVTLVDVLPLVPVDSSDPLRRIRTAMGKLVFKRSQCSRRLCEADFDENKHESYIRHLRAVEHDIRNLLLEQLTHTHSSVLATSADERGGTMDTLDEEEYGNLEWKKEGNELVGKEIFRPPFMHSTDAPHQCIWYTIESWSLSIDAVAGEDEKSEPIGNAKEPRMVERRKRFYAVPRDDEAPSLMLTEGQVIAGLRAAEQENHGKQESYHPFTKDIGSKVSMVSVGDSFSQLNGTIAGIDTLSKEDEVVHKILVLPDSASFKKDAFWASMNVDVEGLTTWEVDEDGTLYTIQQFDYDLSSAAWRECRNIVSYLEKNPKAAPFLDPVDPVALGVPHYFDIIKEPMDVSTLLKKLESGRYATIPPHMTVGRSPTCRMLKGPFRRDVELIFDNAINFNPPDDWIHVSARALKKLVLKKIDVAAKAAEESYVGSRKRKSLYVDEDSDYEYESDSDFAAGNRKRKRQEKSIKEDSAARPIERPIRLEKMIDADGLRGPLSNLPINSESPSFSLPSSEWTCKASPVSGNGESIEGEMELIRELHLQQALLEQASSRRGRKPVSLETTKMSSMSIEYFIPGKATNQVLRSRRSVELYLERAHEELAKAVPDCYAGGSFPPYLGRVVNGTWEIRSQYVNAAVRWVLRGLVASNHLHLDDNQYLVNNAYYIDPLVDPLDQLDTREIQKRKKTAKAEESDEEEVELSAYEKLRAERVARNAERLKALGL